jgi:rare lipoprotein A
LSITRCGRRPRITPRLSRASRGRFLCSLAAAGLALALAGCSEKGSGSLKDESQMLSPRVVELGQPVPKGGGVYKVGAPYNVGGDIYVPKAEPNYDKIGMASWYGELFHGRRTSNGEIYDMDSLTAAHPTLPIPSYVRVTNLTNNRTVVLRINDRGPYKRDRILDMSQKAAEILDLKRKGFGTVRVQYLGSAPLDGNDVYERRVLAMQPWATQVEQARPLIAGLTPPQNTRIAQAAITHGFAPPSRGLVVNASASAPALAQPAARHGVFIQAGVFRNPANAEQVRRKAAAYGPVEVMPITMGGDTLHRVSIGPFAGEREARAVMERAGPAGLQGAVVVSR